MNEIDQSDLVTFELLLKERRDELVKGLDGSHYVHALSTRNNCPYVYTAGLTPHLGYELVAMGLTPESGTAILSAVARRLRRGHVHDGQKIKNIAEQPLMLLTQSIRDRSGARSMAPLLPLIFGIGLVPMQVRQVCWPDAAGKYPWDDGFDRSYPDAVTALMQAPLSKLN